jgi:hypothetical protein
MGAASRSGIGGLQCQRVSYRAGGLIPNLDRRRSADAVTLHERSSAKHHPDDRGDEDTQAATPDLGSGVDQQEV